MLDQLLVLCRKILRCGCGFRCRRSEEVPHCLYPDSISRKCCKPTPHPVEFFRRATRHFRVENVLAVFSKFIYNSFKKRVDSHPHNECIIYSGGTSFAEDSQIRSGDDCIIAVPIIPTNEKNMETSLALTIIGSVLILVGVIFNVIPKVVNQKPWETLRKRQ